MVAPSSALTTLRSARKPQEKEYLGCAPEANCVGTPIKLAEGTEARARARPRRAWTIILKWPDNVYCGGGGRRNDACSSMTLRRPGLTAPSFIQKSRLGKPSRIGRPNLAQLLQNSAQSEPMLTELHQR